MDRWAGISRLCVVFIFLFSGVCGAAAGRSGIIRAAEAGRAALEVKLDGLRDSDWAWHDYIKNPDNYDLGVSEGRTIYVVIFKPRDKNIRGYVFEFWVEKEGLKVVKFIGHE